MNIKINGTTVNVEENDEIEIEATNNVAAEQPTMDEVTDVLEAKETLGSKIRNLPWWKKAAAIGGALAGGAFIASRFSSSEPEEDEDDEDETDEDEDNEEE